MLKIPLTKQIKKELLTTIIMRIKCLERIYQRWKKLRKTTSNLLEMCLPKKMGSQSRQYSWVYRKTGNSGEPWSPILWRDMAHQNLSNTRSDQVIGDLFISLKVNQLIKNTWLSWVQIKQKIKKKINEILVTETNKY